VPLRLANINNGIQPAAMKPELDYSSGVRQLVNSRFN